jgi:polyphosphate:AMP phosphotransferase
MFESAEIGHAIDKDTYEARLPALREALLEAQYELKEQARFPVIVLINGVEGAGKGETVKLLNEWMDPRLIEVRTFDDKTDEELAHPPAWRYWRQLPAKGRMGVFFGNWYSQMIQDRVHGDIKDGRLEQAINGAQRLERMLHDEGALIFKFWFHLSKQQMKARLKSLRDDPLHSWRISPLDWQQSKTYDRFVRFGERVVRRTDRDYAPWHVIEGADAHYRSLAVGQIILEGLQAALKAPVEPKAQAVATLGESIDKRSLIGSLDLSKRLEKDDYERQLITEQARLAGLMRDKRMRRHALVAVFEGNDAAGKGGAIKRVAAALDPRQYHIVPIAAPTQDELAQPYLWRFWRQLPARGKFTVFDRSWYGRVLVERVEGFCSASDWMRAYSEINDFEEQLTEAGVVLVKFWLAIDEQTQLERFKEREQIPFKRFKITEDDWRNREKWGAYRLR